MQNPRILIVRTDRIGDVVLSTPLPRAIKKRYAKSFVAVLVRNYTKDIYLNNPFVDEIIVEDENGNSFLNLLKKLRGKKFTHSLSLLPTEKINWLLFLSGIKKRIGVGHKFYQFLTNTKSVFRNKYKPLRHETDYCLDEIRKIGIEDDGFDEELFLTEEEKNKSVEFKKSICRNGELLIGVNTTSGNSAPNLTTQEYISLINKLKQIENIQIIITEIDPPEELFKIDDIHFFGKGSKLRENIVKFSCLDLLISSSTGPMHIAAGLNVKTLSLFCPLTACSPDLWGPKGNDTLILLPENEYCKNKCPGDPKICDYSGEGGIDAAILVNRIKAILNLSD